MFPALDTMISGSPNADSKCPHCLEKLGWLSMLQEIPVFGENSVSVPKSINLLYTMSKARPPGCQVMIKGIPIMQIHV